MVIPTFNADPFIRRTLESVFAQTRLPDEIVVVDDCSMDESVAVVEQVADGAPVPIRLIRLTSNSGGPSRPLNVGVAEARSAMIALLDQDDRFHPKKLERQAPVLEANEDLGLVFGDLCIDGNATDAGVVATSLANGIKRLCFEGQESGWRRLSKAAALDGVLDANCFVGTCSNLLFRKAIWEDVRGFREAVKVAVDYAFLCAVASKYDLGYVPGALTTWRIHQNSFFARSDELLKIRDQILALDCALRSGASSLAKVRIRKVIARMAFDGAYAARTSGQPREAVKCLCLGAAVAGWSRGLLKELVKVAACAVLGRRKDKVRAQCQ